MNWPGQASEHDADHGETDEGGDGARVSLEVARQAAVAADPRERSFDDPTFGQDDELVQFVALDDFDDPMTRVWQRLAPRVVPDIRHRRRCAR